MGGNHTLDESVLPLLHPLGCLRALDVSDSRWLSNRGLYQIGGFQGLVELMLVHCYHITVPGIMEMISRGCGPLIRVTVDDPLSSMPGYQAGVEHMLRGPVGACNIYCTYDSFRGKSARESQPAVRQSGLVQFRSRVLHGRHSRIVKSMF